MSIMVGVAGKGDVEAILRAIRLCMAVARGGVHADLAIPIRGMKRKVGSTVVLTTSG